MVVDRGLGHEGSCGATMAVDRQKGHKVFFEPIPKHSAGFSYVFLRAVYM